MLRHRKKHSNAPHLSTIVNGNGSSINNSASDMSDDESTAITMINHKKMMEMMPESMKQDQHSLNHLLNPFNKELFMELQKKLFNRQQQLNGSVGSDLLGNLLGISDLGMLNKMISSSADEAAKILFDK